MKGEINDSQEIIQEVTIKVRSVYVFICEMNDAENTELTLFNQNAFKLNKFVYDQMIAEKTQKIQSEILGAQEILPDELQDPSSRDEEIFESAQSREDDAVKDVSTNNLRKDRIRRKNRSYSRSEGASLSFEDHLEEINASIQIEESVLEEENRRAKQKSMIPENYSPISQWWKQKLIVLIEILDMSAKVWKYRNGKSKTVEGHPLTVRSILVSTPLNLARAWNHKKLSTKDYAQHSSLDYPSLLINTINYDFKTLERESNPMIEFLRGSDCEHYADFILLYQR